MYIRTIVVDPEQPRRAAKAEGALVFIKDWHHLAANRELPVFCNQQAQVFITDPNEERVKKAFEELGKEIQVYSL